MKRGARLVLLVAVIAAIVFTLASCAPGEAVESPGYVSGDGTVTIFSESDQPDPLVLTGTSFAGEPIDVADYRGQAVIVNTWYASCPPCRAEAPDLVAADARDDVQVVGINGRDDAATAEAFDRTFGAHYPSIDDKNGEAVAALQGLIAVNAVPSSVILDTEGRIYARVIGRVEPSTLTSLLDGALGIPDSAGGTAPSADAEAGS
ncbi:TlpA family protein disulfide reductase [Demequina aurantiaca]|uniref:TlpA family protein disulfide reductase n=1 Tax=Demequina aurantiaca TaxID=676200 RepID=UPI000A071A56|nr:TlpA disulfide reductase family protein [Demequina aurantiaca]